MDSEGFVRGSPGERVQLDKPTTPPTQGTVALMNSWYILSDVFNRFLFSHQPILFAVLNSCSMEELVVSPIVPR